MTNREPRQRVAWLRETRLLEASLSLRDLKRALRAAVYSPVRWLLNRLTRKPRALPPAPLSVPAPAVDQDALERDAFVSHPAAFWHDPRRWDGIDDPHKVMLWDIDRPKLPTAARMSDTPHDWPRLPQRDGGAYLNGKWYPLERVSLCSSPGCRTPLPGVRSGGAAYCTPCLVKMHPGSRLRDE